MTHAAVIARSLERLPTAVPAETVDDAEAHLVERAKAWHPAGVATLAMKRESVLDPDGCLEDERERKQRRGMTVGKDLHGMHEAVLMLDPESANELMVHVQPLATPQTADDGSPDPRTTAQRRLDALMHLVRWGSENTAMPKPGGRPVHVAVTTTLAELYDRAGLAYLNNGDPLSIQDLLAKAGETDVALTVFGTAGEVLHHGRAQRLAPTGLRHAVIARDKGCQFDACDAPPLYCDAHHVTWWSRGGATDIDNLMLLCGRHHSLIHKEHWRAAMLDGVPHVIPPPWIDPHQKPRRNRMHDPPPRPG